jgi:hypothetical protein
MSALDIFVKEPLMEWKKYEMKQSSNSIINSDEIKQSGSNSESLESVEKNNVVSYPQQKINIINQKLTGVNPWSITGTGVVYYSTRTQVS